MNNGSGSRMLLTHLIVSCIGWASLNNKSFGFQLAIVMIISLTLIILWYDAIRTAGKDGFMKSFIMSLYFTVPSMVTAILYFYSYQNQDELGLVFFDLIWSILNYPMAFGSTVLQIPSPFTANIWIQIALPIIMINLLVAVNLIGNIVNRRFIHTPTN